jgi:hypothetical protein
VFRRSDQEAALAHQRFQRRRIQPELVAVLLDLADLCVLAEPGQSILPRHHYRKLAPGCIQRRAGIRT